MSRKVFSVSAFILIVSVTTQAVLFSDDFDVDSSASWNIISSSSDTSATFAFDYSTIGVTAAPNGGGTTLGVRLAANMEDPTSVEAITISPMGQNFTGSYQIRFDMWVNANGPTYRT